MAVVTALPKKTFILLCKDVRVAMNVSTMSLWWACAREWQEGGMELPEMVAEFHVPLLRGQNVHRPPDPDSLTA